MTEEFVLDQVENPHPVMLAGALAARNSADQLRGIWLFYWAGYLQAMADATGEEPDALVAWMDRAS